MTDAYANGLIDQIKSLQQGLADQKRLVDVLEDRNRGLDRRARMSGHMDPEVRALIDGKQAEIDTAIAMMDQGDEGGQCELHRKLRETLEAKDAEIERLHEELQKRHASHDRDGLALAKKYKECDAPREEIERLNNRVGELVTYKNVTREDLLDRLAIAERLIGTVEHAIRHEGSSASRAALAEWEAAKC